MLVSWYNVIANLGQLNSGKRQKLLIYQKKSFKEYEGIFFIFFRWVKASKFKVEYWLRILYRIRKPSKRREYRQLIVLVRRACCVTPRRLNFNFQYCGFDTAFWTFKCGALNYVKLFWSFLCSFKFKISFYSILSCLSIFCREFFSRQLNKCIVQHGFDAKFCCLKFSVNLKISDFIFIKFCPKII